MLKKREPVYQALWAGPCDFDEVLISPVMIQDHMPDNMLAALNKVSSQALLAQGKHPNLLTNHISSSVTKPGAYEPLEETREASVSSANRNGDDDDEIKPVNGDAVIIVNELEKPRVELNDEEVGDERESPSSTTLIVVDVEVHQRNEMTQPGS